MKGKLYLFYLSWKQKEYGEFREILGENGNIWKFPRISVLIDEFSHFRFNILLSVVNFVFGCIR